MKAGNKFFVIVVDNVRCFEVTPNFGYIGAAMAS